MWSLLDHLNSVLLAGTVILLLLAIQLDGQKASIDATERYSGRPQLKHITDWIERDLANIRVDSSRASMNILEAAWGDSTGTLTFVALADTLPGATPDTIRYEFGGRVLRRYEIRAGHEHLTARTSPTLQDARVTLLDECGRSTDVRPVHSVVVHLEMKPPLAEDAAPYVWHRRFYPMGLRRSASSC